MSLYIEMDMDGVQVRDEPPVNKHSRDPRLMI